MHVACKCHALLHAKAKVRLVAFKHFLVMELREQARGQRLALARTNKMYNQKCEQLHCF